ncbi:MAG: glycosyltransferase [Gammaproteobacteria bacterium]
MRNLTYITYQTFPANTANSLQTISNIAEIVKQGVKVKLIFPDRDDFSSDSLVQIQNFYGIEQDFEIVKLKHNLPFGKVKFFNKLTYHLSHFLWSKKTVKNLINNSKNDYFFTRSDWIFYFLSKQNKHVIFECHQPSKIRNIILKVCLSKKTSKIIFLNDSLFKNYQKLIKFDFNYIVLNNGYKNELFKDNVRKKNNQIIFVGELLRFGTTRNIEFIISCFEDQRLDKYNLKIVGGPEKYIEELKKNRNNKFPKNIDFLGRLSHLNTINMLQESEIGLLINSSKNSHSVKFTSPLKYFEYLAAGLKIIAVDFESHRELPFASNILFFNENSKESFIRSILNSVNLYPIQEVDYVDFSIENRVKSMLSFARLEGLEPPTL